MPVDPKKFWKVTRMWEGQTVAILASGHSMSCELADRVKDVPSVRAIVVNNTFRLASWADLLYAADAKWWDVHQEKALKFQGLKVCAEPTTHADVIQIRISGERGFDPNPEFVRTGSNSGYQAVHLAIHTGVKRILLCGFDMHGKHWHPEHEKPLKVTDQERYKLWVPRFSELRKQMPDWVEVLNCTPNSAIKCFPFVDIDTALKREQPCAVQFA